MDIIKSADWLIDLDPEAGDEGVNWRLLGNRRSWQNLRKAIRVNIYELNGGSFL